jgi:hypothetical protein
MTSRAALVVVALPVLGTLAEIPSAARSLFVQASSIRDVTLAPDRYVGREVTVVGRFRGRQGDDEPSKLKPLNRSPWDFVLEGHDAAIWVSGMRPHGPDFNLDPSSSRDARNGRWLEVTGLLHAVRLHPCTPEEYCRQLWIAATRIAPARAIPAAESDVVHVPSIVEPPPVVVFSVPVPDETDVPRNTSVRVQFSQDMQGASFSTRVRVSYTAGPPDRIPAFRTKYDDGRRSLTIQFLEPLERFQAVNVELTEGITARDGQPLPTWTLHFTTGR